MEKQVLCVALFETREEAVEAAAKIAVDLAFYERADLRCIYCVCTYETEEKLPRKYEYAPPMGWRIALPTRLGNWWYPLLYKANATYEEMVAQLREYFEIVEVEVK